MHKIIYLFLVLIIYNIDCQGRSIVVSFEQTIVDSVFLFEFNEGWIFNSKGKVKNNIVTLKCSDSPSFYEIRYGKTRIGLYLFKDENKLDILNNTVVRSDSINYIINSQLDSLNDIILIQNVIKNCSNESLKIFLNMKLAASNNFIENLYPCYYINYLNKIPELTAILELFFEKNFKLKNKEFVKQLSKCIHTKANMKLYYKFFIKNLFRESSYLKCEVIKLVLNEERDTGFSDVEINYLKSICQKY